MQLISLLLTIVVFFATPSAEYLALKQQAEAAYQEKSFSRSRTLYEQAAKLDLGSDEKRWVAFRIADAAWRADAANPANDPTAREDARRALESLIAESRDNHDRVFAEANESLGDYFAMHPQQRNPYNARQYWSAALDWWAGSDELAVARRRYLDIVWKFAQGRYGRDAYEDPSQVPRDVVVNALAIADNPQDRAHARFILAAQLLLEGSPVSVERGLEHLEQIVREGRGTDYYDDALFVLASRYANEGVFVIGPNGLIASHHDYVKALELYRRIVSEFKEGESRHREAAQRAIEEITSTSIDITAQSTFLPDSEQELILSARNVRQVELAVVPVDLTRDVVQDDSGWTGGVRGAASKAIRRWTHKTADQGDHAPVVDRIRVEPKLPPGAYDVIATSGSHTEHQLLLITDAHVLIHAAGGKLHVLVSNVLTGEPLPKANVRASWRSEKRAIVTRDATADANGLAIIETPANIQSEAFVTAAAGLARQAYHSQWVPQRNVQEAQWRIYAFTDRPAYRPDETVRWKLIARTRDDDRWTTPANGALDYVINDSRGQKVAGGRAQLNEFGSFWSELPLTAQLPLGVYTIQFTTTDKRHVGAAQLFRLEEYKLPEFRVDVATPAGKRYRLGDTIEATIDASYYFGGPVANATVIVLVHESPYYRHWMPWREYDWFFPDDERQATYRHRGPNIIKSETLRTDENGRAIVRIDTPGDGQEREYTIEAQVIDASRREVRGSGSVRVLRNRYSVVAYPLHYIHRPNEKVEIRFKAEDANGKPVQTTGNVRVLRRRLERRVAKDDEITTGRVTTNAEGEATFTFTPNREGFFVVQWASPDTSSELDTPSRVRDLVTAETSVWVTHVNTTDLGWHGNDLQIIVDKESFRSGQSAPVMIVTPASGRTVLLSVSGDEIMSSQVLRLDGTVKLVQLPIDERHVPNFFITASSVFDRAIWTDTERIAVPPVEHFIDVDVKADREQYEPRQEGTVTITTRDADGKPVAAEVALAVADESVTAIQNELAGDPRRFFFGDVRGQAIQVGASLHSQQYTRLVEKEGRLIDDRVIEAEEQSSRSESVTVSGVEGGVMGGASLDAASPAPPPPPMVAPQFVSESVTVTASAPAATRQLAKSAAANEAAPQQIDVQVRSDFSSTAFWQPNVLTGPSGSATVKVKFPESLTTWRATARAVSTATQVGIGSATTRTNLPLVVRLQAPRFFVVGDRATVSAVINNNTNAEVSVTPAIEVVGLTLADRNAAAVKIAANGEARVDWIVQAETHGNAKIRVTGRDAAHGDAMERTYPVFAHGIDKLVARSGKLRGSEALVKLELPKERRATALSVQVAPSLAVAMLDALPYLIDFPYGCTEQTMSRFLPAAIVARTLAAHGLDAKRDRRELAKLDEVTRQSVARLFDMQHGDGGWGWWKEGDSDAFMTAYVVWGFSIAKEGGIP
ncbi:MAG TPA: MG2 domain-containing protein, partial [Thermoanaerobaculia bacterium]